MGNFIFGLNPLSYSVTATSSATDYTCTNLYNYTNLRRQWRSTSTAQQTLNFTFSTAQTIVGVMIDDTNFTGVTVGGSAFTIVKDVRVNRYKIYADKTSADTTSFSIVVASQTPVDSAAYFRIGRILFITNSNKITLAGNISLPFPYSAEQPNLKIGYESGGAEIISLGTYFAFSCTMKFNYTTRTTEGQLHTLNLVSMNSPIVIYENNTNTSQAYVCYKEGGIEITELGPDVVSINSFKFMEYI